jgi:hypothetical protein
MGFLQAPRNTFSRDTEERGRDKACFLLTRRRVSELI